MQIVLIRHGEPDYTAVTQKGFIGHGRDLAHLTEDGKAQAEEAAKDPRLDGIELIVASPYTRALQTAAIISRRRNIPIEIELDLHEWLPDLTYTYPTDDLVVQAGQLMRGNKGICPTDSPIKFEELSAVFKRANACLQKYLGHKKIAVVCHAVVIRQFFFVKDIPFCGIFEIDFDEKFEWIGWQEHPWPPQPKDRP